MNFLKGAFFLDRRHLKAVRKAQKDLSLSDFSIATKETVTVKMWAETEDHILVPRLYGEGLGLPFKDLTSSGEVVEWPVIPELRDYQIPFVDKIHRTIKKQKCLTAKAYTGSGKTICSLEVARRLGINVLVILDMERLLHQWVDALQKVFGLPESSIGIVQGTNVRYQGTTVTIAMAQTLFSRDMGDAFYDHFGLTIWDESKVAGAPVMSSVLMQVNSRYRLGLDATPHRKDVFEKVLRAHLGEVQVKLEKKHKKSVVRIVESPSVFSWYANVASTTGRYLSEIASNTDRNILLARIVKRFDRMGRDTLALSERVDHLYVIRSLCRLLGVPDDNIAVYAGESKKWAWVKDPTPKRKPIGYERGTPYTPVKLALKGRKTKQKDVEIILSDAKIILATYKVFGKGVDVPRLSVGVELMPVSSITQAHGRVLRKYKNKKTPIWVTVRDINSFRAENQLKNRILQYVNDSNAEIYQWPLQKKLQPHAVEPLTLKRNLSENIIRLKAVDFTTGKDGRLTKMIRPTGRLQSDALKKLTTKGETSRSRL